MTWTIRPGGSLRGEITVPGDKSVTQRAYIFAAMAKGTSRIVDPLRSGDADNTLGAVRCLGPVIDDRGEEITIISEGASSFTTVKVEPPPQRQKGIMVKDVAELVDALKKKGLV